MKKSDSTSKKYHEDLLHLLLLKLIAAEGYCQMKSKIFYYNILCLNVIC